VFGFVVGPLGVWYPGNERALDELYVSKRYRTLFRKLCCADSIKAQETFMWNTLQGFLNIKQY
jgi:hypothetical protein